MQSFISVRLRLASKIILPAHAVSLRRLAIIQAKDAIVDRVLARAGRNELEELTKVQRVVSSNANGSSDKNDNAVLCRRWLNVGRFDFMRHRANARQLLNNVLGALKWASFKGEHGVLRLQEKR